MPTPRVFALALVLYVALGAALLRVDLFPQLDTLAYVSVAQKYAAGDLQGAVNGYWSPLTSWAMAPLLSLGFEGLAAFRVVGLLAGALTMVGLRRLGRHFEMERGIRDAAQLALVPVLLSFTYTPDLVVVCVLVFYLDVLFAADYPSRPGAGILAGVLGGVAYLAKAYALPFFLVHFAVSHALRSFGPEVSRARLWTSFAAGLVAFGLIAGSWAAALTNKYGTPTATTAAAYNFAAHGPGSLGHPIYYAGLLAPPNETALSAWEDPTLLQVEPRPSLDTPGALRGEVLHVIRNARDAVFACSAFSVLSLAFVLSYVLFCLPLGRRTLASVEAQVLAVVLLYPSGYLLFHVKSQRFLWLLCLLFLLMGGHCIHRLVRGAFFTPLRRRAVVLLFALSFLPAPVLALRANHALCRKEIAVGDALERDFDLRGSMASNKLLARSRYLAYRAGCRYFGKQRRPVDPERLLRELEEHEVDYYVFWRELEHGFDALPPFLAGRPDVTGGRFPSVRIYALRSGE